MDTEGRSTLRPDNTMPADGGPQGIIATEGTF